MQEYANSSQYFENRECKYYPCHADINGHINCMFCYCPFYPWEKCPGKNEYKTSKSGNRVKVCTNCTFPHDADNYDKVIEILRMGKEKYAEITKITGAIPNSIEDMLVKTQPTFYGIGVGPGEAELITLKAKKIIDKVDVLILPAKDRQSCRAYSIVEKAIPQIVNKQCEFMPFPMSMKEPELSAFHRMVADRVEELLDNNKNVGFLTIGDVSIYSTFDYIDRILKADGYDTSYISGIPSFVAAAARLGESLTIGNEEMHIIPGSADAQEALKLSGTIVFMKSGKQLGVLKEYLIQGEEVYNWKVCAVSNCGMDNEEIVTGAKSISDKQGYLTVVIVKK